MEQIVWEGVAVATVCAGVSMVVWPAWAFMKSLDEDETRPPNWAEIWFMRVVGVGLVFGGVYGLYAIVTDMPGVPGPPLP
jgi:hypothetical protein